MPLDQPGFLPIESAILKVDQFLKDRAPQWHSAPGLKMASTIIESLTRRENTSAAPDSGDTVRKHPSGSASISPGTGPWWDLLMRLECSSSLRPPRTRPLH